MRERFKNILFIFALCLIGASVFHFFNIWKENLARASLNFEHVDASILNGQPVLMANGSQKNIENVKVGDEIISYNVDTKITEKDKVTEVLKGSHDEYIVFNDVLKTSLDHVIFANNEFMPAKNINIGDFLMDSQRNSVIVLKIDHVYEKVETFDLVIEKNHTFFASNYLVHNPLPVLYQQHFKIYQDDAGLNSATAYANEDTNYNIAVNTNFRIRFATETNDSGSGTKATIRRLEFKEDSGSWTQITTDSNNVRLADSSNFSDGDATTQRLTVSSGWSFVAGQGKDTGSDTSSVSLAIMKHIEDEYSLKFQSGAAGHTYQFRITNAGTAFTFYYQTPSISPPDITAPTVSTLSPADNTTAVAVDSNLVITFSEAVDAEAGADNDIVIKKTSDNSTIETIDSQDAKVTGSGTAIITINPAATLSGETSYYVQIGADAFDDAASNSFAGIADTTTWNFTSADITAPTVSTLSPADNATAVAVDSNLVITFSEAVDAETGNINLYKTVGDVLVQAFDVTTDITGTGTAIITANPTSNLLGETAYYVKIDATAFDDAASNSFAGIADTTTWNFTSADIAAPTRSNGSPSGSQSAGTTQITMSLTTDENATCKYSSTAGTAYGSMTGDFSTTGGTSHSVAISGLSNGQSYNYYVRCQDGSNNANSDNYTISFSVASSSGGGGLPPEAYNLPSAPMGGFKIVINQGANTTANRTVTLNFNAGSDVKKMAISLTGDFNDASQEDYLPTKQIDLCSKFSGLIKNPTCPVGQYTVYVKFYTQYGQASGVVSQKITLVTAMQFSKPATTLTKDLKLGSKDSQIRILQQFLNQNGYKLTNKGYGSPGNETDYFGSLISSALAKFQEANKDKAAGLIAEKGYLGPITRQFINSSTNITTPATPVQQTQNPPSAIFTTPLYKGIRSEDVRRLQKLLASKPEIYPEGLITGYFGVLTKKAVQRFQLKYNVVSLESDPGFGYVGPKTRLKLQEVFGN